MSDLSDHDTKPHGSHSHLNIPALPDLRFESSYLRSIRLYLNEEEQDAGHECAHTDADALASGHRSDAPVVKIEWKGILWVTARDQILTPVLQGFLWGIASQYILPLPRIWWDRTREPRLARNGDNMGWLRKWVRPFTGEGRR